MRWSQQDYDAFQARRSSSRPIPKPIVQHEPLAEAQGKEAHPAKIQVRITSYRRRLLDPDNLAGGCKFFVDCCRYAKLIPDDRPQDIILETRQEKVGRGQERTEIEIVPL